MRCGDSLESSSDTPIQGAQRLYEILLPLLSPLAKDQRKLEKRVIELCQDTCAIHYSFV